MIYQVLIVDDEEIVCRGMAQFVKWKEHGFEVAGIAVSVDEALLMLSKMHIDVVLTDIRMPEKSGIDLLKQIQELYPDIQTVVLSGYSDFDYAIEAMRYRAVQYLTKPVNLGEVEELLGRLSADLERRQKEARLHTYHMEGLLLSIARGYADADIEKYCLPVLEKWYGISIFMTDKNLNLEEVEEEKKVMKSRITAVIPDSILLDSSMYALFAIVPVKSDSEFTYFISILEQVCCSDERWAMGVSKEKNGIQLLPDAWKETEQAMRYLLADTHKKVIYYQNIDTLFSEKSSEIQEIITEFLQKLNGAENRKQAIYWIKSVLTEMESREQMSVLEFQTVCIRFLIEVNGHLQGAGLEEINLHDRLNEVLQDLLSCENAQDVMHCMSSYLEWIITEMDQVSSQRMNRGVISEIQSFIRLHYSDNISLNMLAKQFYMHPNYLSRLFKEKTGENFVEYLTEVRMRKVQDLLKNSDYKIIEICGMVGYDNPRSFSKAFKHYTGMTPREFRESNQTAEY